MNNKQSTIINKPIKIAIVVIIIALGVIFMFNLNSKKDRNQNSGTGGVLALNVEKPKYLTGEKVVVRMASLDKDGQTLCNSNLELTVDGAKVGGVKKSSTCTPDFATYDPDYIYEFTASKAGTYRLKLTNLDTKNFVIGETVVVDQRDLDITRLSPTRIKPTKEPRYSMIISITANKDFKGEISDIVPKGLSIPWQGPASVTENSDGGKTITWQADLKAGENKEFAYEFTAPQVSPAVYKFGQNSEWSIVAAK